jgi:hypothetical protein
MAENDMPLQIYSHSCIFISEGFGRQMCPSVVTSISSEFQRFLELIGKGPAANGIVGRGHRWHDILFVDRQLCQIARCMVYYPTVIPSTSIDWAKKARYGRS